MIHACAVRLVHCKFCQSPGAFGKGQRVLIKAGKHDSAQCTTEAIRKVRAIANFLRQHAMWEKSRFEGKRKRRRGPVDAASSLEEAAAALHSLSIDVPAWGLFCAHAAQVDNMIHAGNFENATTMVTAEKLAGVLKVGIDATPPWLARSAEDILLGVLKVDDVSVVQSEMKKVLALLNTELYERTADTQAFGIAGPLLFVLIFETD